MRTLNIDPGETDTLGPIEQWAGPLSVREGYTGSTADYSIPTTGQPQLLAHGGGIPFTDAIGTPGAVNFYRDYPGALRVENLTGRLMQVVVADQAATSLRTESMLVPDVFRTTPSTSAIVPAETQPTAPTVTPAVPPLIWALLAAALLFG